MDLFQKTLWIKPQERKNVLLSFFLFFNLLCAYFILRPLRDEIGVQNGAANMQWLFTGTFLAMLLIIPVFGHLNNKYKPFQLLSYSYLFFFSNILCFYVFFELGIGITWLASLFFIWVSVFNLFVVSLFWSFMTDVFSSTSSKRVFGFIAAGGSLGALCGPLISNYLSHSIELLQLLLVAAFFLLVGMFCLVALFISQKNGKKNHHMSQRSHTLYRKGLFEGVRTVWKSTYLLGIVTFVLLYTTISTFLYFEQAHLLEVSHLSSSDRVSYFAKVDLATNTLAIVGQLLFTARIIKKIGLSYTMASIPLLVALGLAVLGFNLSIALIAMLLVIHRAGNFFLLRPSKEILFTVTPHEYKYQSKNFIDTSIYRGGDAFVGWLFAGLTSFGIGLSTIAILAIPLALLWSYKGLRLGSAYLKKEIHVNSQ